MIGITLNDNGGVQTIRYNIGKDFEGLMFDELPEKAFPEGSDHYLCLTSKQTLYWQYKPSEDSEWVDSGVSAFVDAARDKIKSRAASLVDALTWRIERAQERDKIGAEGESVGEVLAEREAIRRASNRAEAELEALTTIEEIEAFAWEVLPSDYPSNPVVTRLSFMRRFTDAERASIREARDSGQSQDLLDFWELLQLSSTVVLTDQDTIDGVTMLETNGLIGAGRAQEILAV